MEMMRRFGAGRLRSFGARGRRRGSVGPNPRPVCVGREDGRRYRAARTRGVGGLCAWRQPLARSRFRFARAGVRANRFEPEPWKPADSLVWGKIMASRLGGVAREVLRAELAETLSLSRFVNSGRPIPGRPDNPCRRSIAGGGGTANPRLACNWPKARPMPGPWRRGRRTPAAPSLPTTHIWSFRRPSCGILPASKPQMDSHGRHSAWCSLLHPGTDWHARLGHDVDPVGYRGPIHRETQS